MMGIMECSYARAKRPSIAREEATVLGLCATSPCRYVWDCPSHTPIRVRILKSSTADNGTLQFYDWKTGYNFQKLKLPPQPGSLESEAGIYAVCARLSHHNGRPVTCPRTHCLLVWTEVFVCVRGWLYLWVLFPACARRHLEA